MKSSRPATVDVNVIARIDAYHPKTITPDEWASVAPFVRHVVRATTPPTPGSATSLLGIATRYALWCVRQGLPLDPEVVLTPDRVDDYLAREGKGRGSSANDAASRLRRMGRAATTTAPWSPTFVHGAKRPRKAPYSRGEVADLLDWAAHQPRPRARRVARAIVLMPLAFGVTTNELTIAEGADLSDDGQIVLLRVRGPKERTVPALAAHADEVRAIMRATPKGERVVPGCARLDNTISKLKLRRAGEPPSVMRLRSTWAVTVLNSGVSVREFMRLSGDHTPQMLHSLVGFLPLRSDADLRRLLGGGDE